MDRLKLILLFIGCVFIFESLHAQVGRNSATRPPEEVIRLTSSEDIVVSGSNLFYQVTASNSINDSLSKVSEIAYIGLFNASGEMVLYQKTALDNGLGTGNFLIEPSLISGEYFLIGATNWSLNNRKSDPVSKINIIVVNPFKSIVKGSSKDSIQIIYDQTIASGTLKSNDDIANISLKTDKKSYGKRQLVEVSIENEVSYKLPFSLTVRKVKPVKILKSSADLQVNSQSDKFFIPEVRGNVIQGSITSEVQSVSEQMVALSVPGDNYVFKLAQTNAKGQFSFYLSNNEYNVKNSGIHVYVPGALKNDFKINLEKPSIDQLSFNSEVADLKIDENLKDWIVLNSTANQIENAYFEIKRDSTPPEPTSNKFYGTLGYEYILDNYTRFSSVEETFVEIISRAALRKDGANYKFKTYNYKQEQNIMQLEIPPLVLIDGIMIKDNNILVNYESEKIEKITIVSDYYRYGSSVFSGIIDVKTFDNDYAQNNDLEKLDYLTPRSNAIFYSPDYSKESDLENIPDYRTQLFWDSKLDFRTKNNLVRQFYTSDLDGWYEIILMGFNQKGEQIKEIQYFKVE